MNVTHDVALAEVAIAARDMAAVLDRLAELTRRLRVRAVVAGDGWTLVLPGSAVKPDGGDALLPAAFVAELDRATAAPVVTSPEPECEPDSHPLSAAAAELSPPEREVVAVAVELFGPPEGRNPDAPEVPDGH